MIDALSLEELMALQKEVAKTIENFQTRKRGRGACGYRGRSKGTRLHAGRANGRSHKAQARTKAREIQTSRESGTDMERKESPTRLDWGSPRGRQTAGAFFSQLIVNRRSSFLILRTFARYGCASGMPIPRDRILLTSR